MSQAPSLLGRASSTGRQLAGSSAAPLTGAVVLALLALIQVTDGAVSNGPVEPVLRRAPEMVDQGPPTVAVLLALLATLPVALVRSHLVVASTAVVLAISLTLAGGYEPTVAATVALLVVVYLVALREASRGWLLLLAPFALLLALPLGAAGDQQPFLATLLLVAASAGIAGSISRARTQAEARRASEEYVAGSLLEHAARGERARIARELHDVVAHHISMISIQAETARLTTRGMPPEGARRLSAIGDTAREALSEMRRLLGVLREDAETASTRAPQPGLDDVLDLVDDARGAAGASTRLIVHGKVTPLEPGVELTAYRIVQEALTNSRRHAPGAAVDVELAYADDALRVRVRDNGPGLSSGDQGQAGHGLLGMRERAAMVGGVVRVESANSGGCLVEASLPIDRAGKP